MSEAAAPDRIGTGAFLSDPGIRRILAVLNPAAGHGQTRVVGGAIRNALMGLPITDVDCATVLPPDEVTRLARAAGLHVVPTGIEHGTVTVVADGTAHEVTTLRRDLMPDGRRARVAFGTDWSADAQRRDFTINALYCDPDGTLHDPLGGIADIRARRVRFIGDPEARIAEDYLRLLRFYRFHAQYAVGPIDDAGFRATMRMRPGLSRLSAERLRQELLKLLSAPRAPETVALLAETGVLIDLVGVPLLGRFERLAAGDAARDEASPAIVRLAALAVRLPEDAERLASRFKLSREETAALDAVARHVRGLAADPSPRAGRHVLHEVPRWFDGVVRVARAEAGAGDDDPRFTALRALPDDDPVPPFPLRGADLAGLGVPAGLGMGQLLAAAKRVWREGDYRATRQDLLALIEGALAHESVTPPGESPG